MKKVLSALLVLLLAFTLVSCAKKTTTEASAAEVVEEKHIDKVVIGLINWPASFDPSTSIGKTITRWISNVYDTVLYCNNDGSISSYICDSWKKVDPTTWEFKLKSGITFHNGDPLTSADVKYSFERVLNNTTGANSANVRAVIAPISEIQIVDDLTFRFITSYEDPIFESRLASYLNCYVVPMNYIEANGNAYFADHPIGTGPYKVDSVSPETMIMSYYEGYYGTRPYADTLEFRYIVEPVAMATALINGEVDICPDLTMESAEIIKARASKDVNVKIEPSSTSHLLIFNTNNPVTKDVKVRQAMNLSIDRKLLADSLWNGYADVPNGYNYPEYGEYYIKDYPEYEYNVEKAKQLLKESSYNGELVEYTLRPGYYAMGNEAAEAIVSMWKEIGINAVVKYNASLKNGQQEEAVCNWSNGLRFSDPLGGLWVLWGEGSTYEKYMWNDYAKFNELGHLVEKETNVEKRKAYYRQMMEIWDGQALGTIIYCPSYITAYSTKLDWQFAQGKAISYRAEYLQPAK